MGEVHTLLVGYESRLLQHTTVSPAANIASTNTATGFGNSSINNPTTNFGAFPIGGQNQRSSILGPPPQNSSNNNSNSRGANNSGNDGFVNNNGALRQGHGHGRGG